MLDTADSLPAYSWAQGEPGRRLNYNVATTAVAVGVYVSSVSMAQYASNTSSRRHILDVLGTYDSLAEHFEMLGYLIAGIFVLAWAPVVLLWRVRYQHHRPVAPFNT